MPKRKSMREHLIKSATKGAARGCGRGCVLFITPFLVLVLVFSFGCALSESFREGFERGWEGEEQTIEEKTEGSTQESWEVEAIENVAEEEMAVVCEIPYEEVGSRGKTIYIYTTAKKLDELKQIVDIYRNERYADVSVFQILFFNNKQNAIHALENSIMSDSDLLALFARYNYNKNTGYDNLSYEDWSIFMD